MSDSPRGAEGPPAGHDAIALLYDDDAYVERSGPSKSPARAGAIGLMGRQVAGKGFLDSYLSHGRSEELVALVRSPASEWSLGALWQAHPGARDGRRRLRIVREQAFLQSFFPTPPATLLHLPNPLDPRYAWARQHAGPAAFALSGITHTICTAAVVQELCNLVTAPYEPFDALICISRAAVDVVRTVTANYADYLRDRHGGNPGLRVRLEQIPLGVDAEKFRPATPDERAESRRALGIDDDEVAVLFVGRLSFHAKVHPFPIYDGLARAARTTGRKVHLVLSGWAANSPILEAFRGGARVFAPGVRVTIVDGTNPEYRDAVWKAADLFTSPSDNIQETLSQVIIEAMACGLPVVATDWDGCRDQVVHGETGFLVPASTVRGAGADTTARLLMGEVSYDTFLGECNQTVVVDSAAAGAAYARLITDEALRHRMGEAGRRRALERFTWPSLIRDYERLWQELEAERRAHRARAGGRRLPYTTPACYPAPEHSFVGYYAHQLDESTRLVANEHAHERLEWMATMPLTNYAPGGRVNDPAILRDILRATTTPCTIGQLDARFLATGIAPSFGRATLAWMLKYGLMLTQHFTPES